MGSQAHGLELGQVLSVEALVLVLENLDHADSIFEKVIRHLRLEVGRQDIKQLVNAIFLGHVDDIRLTALKEVQHFGGELHIETLFDDEILQDLFSRVLLRFGVVNVGEDPREPRDNVRVH